MDLEMVFPWHEATLERGVDILLITSYNGNLKTIPFTRSTFFSRASILRIDVFDCKNAGANPLGTTWWFAVSLRLHPCQYPAPLRTCYSIFSNNYMTNLPGKRKAFVAPSHFPLYRWIPVHVKLLNMLKILALMLGSVSIMQPLTLHVDWMSHVVPWYETTLPRAFQFPGSQAVIEGSETNGVILHIVKVVLRHVGNNGI